MNYTFIKFSEDGSIEVAADRPFPDSIAAPYPVVLCAWNNRLYKQGEEPPDPGPSIEDQLTAIEAKYEQKQAELDNALVATLRMDGAQEAAARTAIKQKTLKLIQDQNDEIDALFAAQQNGG